MKKPLNCILWFLIGFALCGAICICLNLDFVDTGSLAGRSAGAIFITIWVVWYIISKWLDECKDKQQEIDEHIHKTRKHIDFKV